MQSDDAIIAMAEFAKIESGWSEDATRPSGSNVFGGLTDKEREHRAYAEGVEAGLRWALGWAGEPFPR